MDLGTGFTPLVLANRLAAEIGLGEVWVKDDTRNPTGSFKDRVVGVALTKARELGFEIAACASTGNLANSVAAHAARAGMESFVFVPHDLEAVKLITTAVFGGHLVAVDGSYDDVNRLCAELASEFASWAFRQRQHPALLLRRFQDARVRGRRTARLAAPRPCRGPDRLGEPAHQDRQGVP